MVMKVAMQKASWDVMHERLESRRFVSWLESFVPGVEIDTVSDEEILWGALERFDAVFYPGSVGSMLAVEKFGKDYRSVVRRFVHEGGRYIGVCGGCYVAARETPLRNASGLVAKGMLRNFGDLMGARKDIRRFDPAIESRVHSLAGREIVRMVARGRVRTFGLVDAVAETPRFLENPAFIRDRWARMVIDGRLLKVGLKVAEADCSITGGHEEERFDCAYSGGAIMSKTGPAVKTLVTYEGAETVPEANGKAAVAYCRYGDGLVVVSGPDCYLPFQVGAGFKVAQGMKPSVGWLTERLFTGNVDDG